MLPFPNEATARAAHQMSIKAIAPKDLPDEFNVHINRIWAKSILDQYAADSAYDWQKTQLLLREKIVSIARKCIRGMEAGLENNLSRIRSQINEFQIEGNEYLAMSKVRIKYPPQSRKYSKEAPLKSKSSPSMSFSQHLERLSNNSMDWLHPRTTTTHGYPLSI